MNRSRRKIYHAGIYEFYEILVGHAYKLGMRTRVESNILILGQRLVDIDIHVIEVPEGRHRAEIASGKKVFEFFLPGNFSTGRAGGLLEKVDINPVVCRENCHGKFLVCFHYNGFCNLFAVNMSGSGDLVSRVSEGMFDAYVLDLLGIQKLFQLLNRHIIILLNSNDPNR